ncbi:MAG: MFS transporter [Phenylobacterium sp.]
MATTGAGNRDFNRLWAAQAVSAFGARIAREGLPIAAVTVLAASPAVLGLLEALTGMAALALGLSAGGWVDRQSRRRILVSMNLVRAAALAVVPMAAFAGVLSVPILLTCGAVIAGASTVFIMAEHAILPGLVPPERLISANARLSATDSVAEIGGPALAGVLFQVLTAPFAVLGTVAAWLGSAVLLLRIRNDRPRKPEPSGMAEGQSLLSGFITVWAHREVRTLFLIQLAWGLVSGVFASLYVLFALRTLALPTGLLGLAIACGGLGALAGAAIGPALARRFGAGRTLTFSLLLGGLINIMIALAPSGTVSGMAALTATQFLGDIFGVTSAILTSSLRQSLVARHLLGRVTGLFEAAAGGMTVTGALGGALLAEATSVRTALLVAATLSLIQPLLCAASPLARARLPAGG